MEKRKYNIADNFNVTMNKGFFHCEKREAIKEQDDEFETKWVIKWQKDGDKPFPNAVFNLHGKQAKTAVFQFIDSLKLN